MIRLASLFIVCLSISTVLSAQTVLTGTVKDTTDHPVAGASVFLSGTTIGTMTDKEGKFNLQINRPGEFELAVSCIGYKSESLNIISDGHVKKIDFKIPVNIISLKEVTVKSRDPERIKNYLLFVRLFIGESSFGESCRILNPEDLHLYRDPSNRFLKAFSLKPLKISNKALGYNIVYDLTDFYYDLNSGFLRYSGNSYFQLFREKKASIRRWERNRLKAYYGSRINLLRALVTDSLNQNDFQIFDCTYDSVSGIPSSTGPLTANDLIVNSSKSYSSLFYKSPVMICYSDRHAELDGSLTGFQPQKHISTVKFNDTIKVYRDGYFDRPYAVSWNGSMANERVGEMVPYDFLQKSDSSFSEGSSAFNLRTENYLETVRNSNSPDQVFLHTDRNLYKPGDTIHFQAYIRDRFTGVFETNSISLYTLLFDSKKNKADSARFKIENSLASGWMVINPEAAPGIYHLVSFTGAMQNYDPEYAFQTDLSVKKVESNELDLEMRFDKEIYRSGDTIVSTIKITGRKGEPVISQKFNCTLYDGETRISSSERKTGSNGETVLTFHLPDTLKNNPRFQVVANTLRKNEPVSSDFFCPVDNPYVEFRFLPEGGNLIKGVEQRIGFIATGFKGEALMTTGLLKNEKGTTIDTIRSGQFGPGVFTCKPVPGMYVDITSGAAKGKTFRLPDPQDRGYSLCVKPVDRRSLFIEVQSAEYSGESAFVTGTMNSNEIFSQELKMNKKQTLSMSTSQLPSGTVQITLFNSNLRPVAERLFYINPDKHLKFSIKCKERFCRTGDQAVLSVFATDGDGVPVRGYFSISVADSVTGYDPRIYSPGIEYTYNYHPFLSANLPARALVAGLETLKDEDLDLLFMVYGWSRYTWNFMRQPDPHNLENFDLLKLKILFASKSTSADRHLDLISLEGPSVRHLVSNIDGEIDLPLDSLPEVTRSVTLMPGIREKKRVQGAMLSIPYNDSYFKSVKLFKMQPVIPGDILNLKDSDFRFSVGDSAIEIPGIDVIARPKSVRVYHDSYEENYQYTYVQSLDYEQLWSSPTFENALRRLTFIELIGNKIYLIRPQTSFFGPRIPALIVFNGMPLYSGGYDYVKEISPYQMTSLTVLRTSAGFTRYGEAAKGGVIFVNTMSDKPGFNKIKNDWQMQHSDDRMLIPIYLYRPYKEFYTPTKFERENDPVFKNYSTTYWNSNIYLDGENPVEIKFINLRRTGPVRIIVNGISTNDLFGSGRASYFVN